MIKWRQKLHIEPPDGWMNDPNGLSFFDGKYHVYFQYSPINPDGSTPRGWGHYSGENLFNMKFDRIVLSPDIPEDRDGVYSGSAIEYNGVLHLFYTGNVKEEGDYDYVTAGRGANVIHVTTRDGSNMSQKKVVLRNSDYPEFCSCHVRDPKVWRDGECWKMVLGARTLDDKGCVLIYKSDDLESWEYLKSVSVDNFGYMWECPDYFEINGKGYLSISPQTLPHEPYRFQNVYQSGYFPAELESGTLGEFTEWDMGFDFYAPQTFTDNLGRRILIGWMGIGDIPYKNPTTELGWQHCLTLPREITVSADGKLLQNPIKELNELRGNERKIPENSKFYAKLPCDIEGRASEDFELIISEKLRLYYKDNAFVMEFLDHDFGGERLLRQAKASTLSTVRIIADMSSIEIYLNGGETVFSTRFYPENDKIAVAVKGFDCSVWDL